MGFLSGETEGLSEQAETGAQAWILGMSYSSIGFVVAEGRLAGDQCADARDAAGP